jgi:hypothetical protein
VSSCCRGHWHTRHVLLNAQQCMQYRCNGCIAAGLHRLHVDIVYTGTGMWPCICSTGAVILARLLKPRH